MNPCGSKYPTFGRAHGFIGLRKGFVSSRPVGANAGNGTKAVAIQQQQAQVMAGQAGCEKTVE